MVSRPQDLDSLLDDRIVKIELRYETANGSSRIAAIAAAACALVPAAHAQQSFLPRLRLAPRLSGVRVLRVNDIAVDDLTELEWRAIRMTAGRLDLELEGSERIIRLDRQSIGAN